MAHNDGVDRARRLHPTLESINQVTKQACRAPVQRFVRRRHDSPSVSVEIVLQKNDLGYGFAVEQRWFEFDLWRGVECLFR